MKLNISFLGTSCQKFVDLENEHKHGTFSETCMPKSVAAGALGYVV